MFERLYHVTNIGRVFGVPEGGQPANPRDGPVQIINMAQPAPPRKGTYSKHVQALNKDQLQRLQSKNSHEIELLEDIRMFNKQKAAMEKTYAEGMIKLTTQYLGKRNQPVPDIQKQEENAVFLALYYWHFPKTSSKSFQYLFIHTHRPRLTSTLCGVVSLRSTRSLLEPVFPPIRSSTTR